jgi:hypothetical protein
MNSTIETGLFLPIRFYETLAEQDRFKRTSEGVALINEVYIFADCKTLCPFQIILPRYSATITQKWRIYCVNETMPAELPVNATEWEIYDDGTKHWISYLGTCDLRGYTNNGKSYLEVEIIDSDTVSHFYYSDLFIINNCDDLYETSNFRLTSPSVNDKRTIDGTNLRITTNT